MKLERNYQKEGTMPKGSGWEYYRANFEAGSIQVNNHTESGKWVYVLFLDTRIDCNDEYPTKELAYSVALAHAVERMEVSLRQLKSAQPSVQADGAYWACEKCNSIVSVKFDVCGLCKSPRR